MRHLYNLKNLTFKESMGVILTVEQESVLFYLITTKIYSQGVRMF